MALASVRFLCQGLSTMPKCSTRSKDLPRLCSYNVSLIVSDFIHLLAPCGPPRSRCHPLCIELSCSSSLWSPAHVYLCLSQLLVNCQQMWSSDLLPTSCLCLTWPPPILLPRWGKVTASVWETITWHSDNGSQRKSPENRNETNSWPYPWGRVETKDFALHKHPRTTCSSSARKRRTQQRAQGT